ncbi:MAG: sensor domain-containing diguanylate cyclase [Proteobacteria bacterium]|nr:sensor domain-containing diguanylate cyclase [Pseudomonadota bacterium]
MFSDPPEILNRNENQLFEGHLQTPQTPALLKELTFQLTITRAMLKTVELDQILYIILSGLTHGDGLNFNRAVLMLAWDRRNELRVTRSAGPANGEEAHRIWEGVKAERLNLETLFDRYSLNAGDPQYLTTKLVGLSVKLNEAKALDSLQAMQFELTEIISHCVATRQPLFINGIEARYHDWASGESITFKNFACAPIFLNGEVFGIILVDNYFNSRIIHADELRGLSGVANLASIALERAMLYKRLKEMAQVDGLTGVFNRRYYEKYLREEFIRSKRLERPLAMIVLDIDFFKQCNDTFGHECGDKVLRQFAQLLRTNTREEDLVARYGGEEFVVLLIGGISENDALCAAEKLRAIVEKTSLAGFEPGKITVSAGVGIVHPTDDFEQLFKRADDALYEAKRAGRNCVRLYAQ